MAAYDPALKLSVYGHVGDGNLHYNVPRTAGAGPSGLLRRDRGEPRRAFTRSPSDSTGPSAPSTASDVLKRSLLDRYADPTGRR